jgi:hypothetical protein
MKASDFLKFGLTILEERGKQYEPQNNQNVKHENSFEPVANAYNAITGANLQGSDVALILDLLKKVRQYSNPTRLHLDSLYDSVNYTALWASNLHQEFNHAKPESTTGDSEV